MIYEEEIKYILQRDWVHFRIEDIVVLLQAFVYYKYLWLLESSVFAYTVVSLLLPHHIDKLTACLCSRTSPEGGLKQSD